MQLHIHLKKDYLSLRFANTADRDTFWGELGKKPINEYYLQSACERFGKRTIQVHLSKVEYSYEWPVQFLSKHIKEILGEMIPVKVKSVQQAALQAAISAAQPKVVFPESVIASTPRAEAIAETLPEKVTVINLPEPLVPMPEIAHPFDVPKEKESDLPMPEAPADPEPTGIHKNSRAYRAWKARQPVSA